MMIVARGQDFGTLSEQLKGKKIHIWTCNTCARLCGVGGTDAAESLADRLRDDGIEITGVSSVSASCMDGKVISKKSEIPEDVTVLALTCSIGAERAKVIFGNDVIDPLRTFGPGYLSDNGEPILSENGKELSSISDYAGPY